MTSDVYIGLTVRFDTVPESSFVWGESISVSVHVSGCGGQVNLGYHSSGVISLVLGVIVSLVWSSQIQLSLLSGRSPDTHLPPFPWL